MWGDGRFVPNVLKRAAAGGLREIGHREKLSDFTYIANLVDAVVAAEAALAGGSAMAGRAFFVTNGEPKPFFEFVEELVAAVGYPPIRGRTPYWMAYAWAAVMETLRAIGSGRTRGEDGLSRFAVRYLATHHYFSIGRIRKALDWTPGVSLSEGIESTVQALRAKDRGTGS